MTILAVFRSRAQTLDFVGVAKRIGIYAQTVSTPQAAGVGCGLSAKFDEVFLDRAKQLIAARGYSSFSGFLKNVHGNYFYDGRGNMH